MERTQKKTAESMHSKTKTKDSSPSPSAVVKLINDQHSAKLSQLVPLYSHETFKAVIDLIQSKEEENSSYLRTCQHRWLIVPC